MGTDVVMRMKLKTMMRAMALLALLPYTSTAAAGAAVADAPVLPARIAEAARQRVAAGVYPAMVIVMVADGRSSITGFGRLPDGHAPDARSVFEIGSITKTFTAALLAQAVRSGQVALDTPVAQLLPDFRIPERSGKPITLGLLAEQYSGLPRLPGNLQPADLGNPYVDYDRDRLRDFLAGYALPRDPGTAYEYSNLGFGLLGQALAEQAHSSYGQLLQQRILAPLGMRSTGTVLTPELRRRLVPGHDETGAVAAHWTFGALAGAGALLSDGADMLRWLQANMGIASTPLSAAMRMSHVPRRDIGDGDRIGLAWMTSTRVGGTVVWHNGITGGYASFIGFTADGRRGVMILVNAAHMPQELGFAALLPGLPVPPLPQRPVVRARADVVALDPSVLAQYAGRYQLAPGVQIGIGVDHGQLRAQLVGEAAYLLYATARDRFSYATVDARLDFERDATGKVVALVLHQPGSDQRAPRVR